jgi:hypothetical protein
MAELLRTSTVLWDCSIDLWWEQAELLTKCCVVPPVVKWKKRNLDCGLYIWCFHLIHSDHLMSLYLFAGNHWFFSAIRRLPRWNRCLDFLFHSIHASWRLSYQVTTLKAEDSFNCLSFFTCDSNHLHCLKSDNFVVLTIFVTQISFNLTKLLCSLVQAKTTCSSGCISGICVQPPDRKTGTFVESPGNSRNHWFCICDRSMLWWSLFSLATALNIRLCSVTETKAGWYSQWRSGMKSATVAFMEPH